ncbi:ribonuclease HII [Clostridiaceae bacterium UIB06]|uniref:Ribonuclease HII n=1 Tax=Clostridium thailandense TaxID=2794346 RepID=A0A949TRH9_9CLOT|nr:ribonuclease HII [Clostridium thailandense]MBV7271976.1 ribonuclease HII [Clostridium thailandense]MCH5137202.1 ribonuclease HII [Clostridiaceae bacterium UIB06]
MNENLSIGKDKIISLEKDLSESKSNLNFNTIKEYVSYIKDNYSFNDKEKVYKTIECLNEDSRKNVIGLAESLRKFIDKKESELVRVKEMYKFDKSFGKYIYVAGVDEVGRGPLAGPIAAAAVVLKLNYEKDEEIILGVKDSKKLSAKNRELLSKLIKEKAVSYNIALLNSSEIDDRGIAWCNNEVLRRAVLGLKVAPDIVLSDGYAVKNLNIHNEFIIKGDAKSASIACASIIAKVYRDNLMREYSNMYTHYGFENNAGYGTEEHIQAIKKFGTCRIHRMSFLKNII